MKRLITFFIALAGTLAAMAQSPEEIISRMEAKMDSYENTGIVMTMDMKIPILGTFSMKNYALGDKTYSQGSMLGHEVRIWTDGDISWTYDSDDNTITIEKSSSKDSSKEGDAKMFSNITDGYDVSIKKETATEWQINCRKSRSNTNKDDPRTMTLVVAKETYNPVSLSATMSGVTVKMHELSFGVTPEQVAFDQARFPDATVIDKR